MNLYHSLLQLQLGYRCPDHALILGKICTLLDFPNRVRAVVVQKHEDLTFQAVIVIAIIDALLAQFRQGVKRMA